MTEKTALSKEEAVMCGIVLAYMNIKDLNDVEEGLERSMTCTERERSCVTGVLLSGALIYGELPKAAHVPFRFCPCCGSKLSP